MLQNCAFPKPALDVYITYIALQNMLKIRLPENRLSKSTPCKKPQLPAQKRHMARKNVTPI